VFSQDYRLSRVFLAGFIAICWTSFFLFNHKSQSIFNLVFDRFFKKNKLRLIVMGPKEWCERLQLEMRSTLRLMSLVNVITVEEDDGLEDRDLPREVAKTPCDLLVFSSDHIGEKTSMRLIRDGDRLGYRCWLPIEYTRRFGRHFSLQKVGLLDVLTPPMEPLENPSNRAMKRVFDLLVSLPVCLTILPLCCLFVWILHRCFSPGPMFFKQERGGRNGLPFMVYKFRSLHVENGSEVQQVSKSDDRIFKGGRLIRKTSIDEIPQFINVVLGNMSVVGPRPHMVEHDKKFAELYEKYGHRRFVKPGVTGLAQVKGFRGEVIKRTDLRHRATLDCFYVSRWNLGFDIKLILLTVLVIFFPPKSAY
ncbi:sugar transferase, partial [Akkermansiaceae bacterium]|nr:sugar transferase [Akkermansiaceae bacterium]